MASLYNKMGELLKYVSLYNANCIKARTMKERFQTLDTLRIIKCYTESIKDRPETKLYIQDPHSIVLAALLTNVVESSDAADVTQRLEKAAQKYSLRGNLDDVKLLDLEDTERSPESWLFKKHGWTSQELARLYAEWLLQESQYYHEDKSEEHKRPSDFYSVIDGLNEFEERFESIDDQDPFIEGLFKYARQFMPQQDYLTMVRGLETTALEYGRRGFSRELPLPQLPVSHEAGPTSPQI